MILTSSQASKLLRRLNEEHETLIRDEKESREYVAALQEAIEDVRPSCEFAQTQAALDALEAKIRVVRHAINLFNATHTVPGFDMTIDAVLVYLPQLTQRREKLLAMSRRLEKQRLADRYGNSANIEYNYANYSIPQAREMFAQVSETLGRLQIALDIVNTQETMEIDI